MKQKKKYINLRLFFIGFLGMMSGILFFYQLLNFVFLNNVSIWLLFFGVLFIASLVLIVSSIFKHDIRKYLKYCIIFALLFLISGGIFCGKVNAWRKYQTFENECLISGQVVSKYQSNNHYVIKLKELKINNAKIRGGATIYAIMDRGIDQISKGDKIETVGMLNLKPLIEDKINISNYVDNFVYSTNVIDSNIVVVKDKNNIIYSIQERLENSLHKGLNNENADIAYGVLVGDKSGLDEGVKNTFSYAGISHLLAVSGLHVGFLVAILTFILNIIRVGRRKRFVITSIVLTLYCIFCNMSPSIVRASLMAIILLLSGVIGEEYDGLNSLGLAGILTLLFFPEDLFSLGFQLSFLCVFMILTMGAKLAKWLNLVSIPKIIATPIALSISVSVGTSIILANVIGRVTLISIIANIIVIPIFSVTYPLLFLCAIISMISSMSGVLIFPQLFLHFIKIIADFFANLNNAYFEVFHLGYLLLFVFLIMSFVIKYLMINIRLKSAICMLLLSFCVALTFIGVNPKEYKNFELHTYYQYDTNSVLITTENNTKYLIGYDEYNTSKFIRDLKIKNLEAMVLPDFQVNKISEYIEFLEIVKTDKLIIPRNDNYNEIIFEELNEYVKVETLNKYEDEINLKFIANSNGEVSGTYVEVNNNKILLPNGVSKSKLSALSKEVIDVDYIIVNNSKYDFRDYGIEYGKIIHCNGLEFENDMAISLRNKSHYVLKLNYGEGL